MAIAYQVECTNCYAAGPHAESQIGAVVAFRRAAHAAPADVQRDAERLDWLQRNCTGASNSERYLPFRVYWRKADIRTALDAAMQAAPEPGEE